MESEIDALVSLFVQKAGTDLETYTTHNHFWYTGTPVDMRAASSMKQGRPHDWIWSVASGRSTCLSKPQTPDRNETRATTEHWRTWVERHIREHMFPQ